MLSLSPSKKKKDYLYRNEQEMCSTKCVLISVASFWFLFIVYLQNKYAPNYTFHSFAYLKQTKAHRFKNNESTVFVQGSLSLHSSMDRNFLFWGNRNFKTSEYLQSLSQNTKDSEIYSKCSSILSSEHPKRDGIWSQAYQEWFIYHNFFFGKTKGIYLDIGAHKPLHLSNTALFDQCLGWNGICVEPTETFHLFDNVRSCNMAQKCVWSETKKLTMIFRSDGDASLIIDEKEQNRIKREVPDRVKDLFECDAIDGTDLLNEYKAKNKFGEEIDVSAKSGHKIEIDLISLDVEGAEVEFLACFPFESYDVKIWSIEINKNEGLIDELMLKNGFVKFEYLSYFHSRLDAIYVQSPITLKTPWVDKEEQEKWSKYKRCPNKKL